MKDFTEKSKSDISVFPADFDVPIYNVWTFAKKTNHPDAASYLRGKRYNGEKLAHGAEPGGRGNQHTAVKDQNDPLPESTADRLASEYKVSAPTIKRDGQYAAAVDKLALCQQPAFLKPTRPLMSCQPTYTAATSRKANRQWRLRWHSLIPRKEGAKGIEVNL